MLRAIDKDGNTVYIDDVDEGQTYFCPLCNQALVVRNKGLIRAHCFAHYPVSGKHSEGYTKCTDTWHHDMSDWHIWWQECFPKEFREIYLTGENGQKHIADVLINNTVIEFQNSGISYSEFRERNSFYNGCGYKVIWLFNLQNEYNDGAIEFEGQQGENIHYSFRRIRKPFSELLPNKENATIYLQFDDTSEDDPNAPCIERLVYVNKGRRQIETSSRAYPVLWFREYLQNNISELIPGRIKELDETEAKKYEEKGGKSIPDLWDESYKSMVVHDNFNGNDIIVYGEEGMLRYDYNYGRAVLKGQFTYKKDGQYRYSKKYYVVKNADLPIWTLVYAKKRDFEAEELEKQQEQREIERLQKEAEERKRIIEKETEEYLSNIDEHLSDPYKTAIDPSGTRWMKCKMCGTISTEDHFYMESIKERNIGICNDCRQDYNALLDQKIKRALERPLNRKCPRCGGDLVRRKGRSGLFVGCSNYPSCRHTDNQIYSFDENEKEEEFRLIF